MSIRYFGDIDIKYAPGLNEDSPLEFGASCEDIRHYVVSSSELSQLESKLKSFEGILAKHNITMEALSNYSYLKSDKIAKDFNLTKKEMREVMMARDHILLGNEIKEVLQNNERCEFFIPVNFLR